MKITLAKHRVYIPIEGAQKQWDTARYFAGYFNRFGCTYDSESIKCPYELGSVYEEGIITGIGAERVNDVWNWVLDIEDPVKIDIRDRLKYFSIPRDRMVDVLLGRIVLDGSSLPEDAAIVNVNADWRSQSIEFLVESASFEKIPEGTVPPTELGIRYFMKAEKGDS